ncbi:MAG: YlxR family protein [Acutalibacteraceae bacterium]|nr:YlxR family protein [Clostridia bacterium]MEE1127391.1 YlxR family protein [Acutalibacteraceae bacterium]
MQTRKQPMRMCTGCGEMKEKRELIRVVKSSDGEISLDKTGKKNGRGAYICHNAACLKKARKNKRIERAFEVTIPDEIYDRMEEEIGADE